jgi:hypothetical protein
MLMSTISAPCSTAWRAAPARAAGSAPAIWTPMGAGSPSWSSRCALLRVRHSRGSAVVISETA